MKAQAMLLCQFPLPRIPSCETQPSWHICTLLWCGVWHTWEAGRGATAAVPSSYSPLPAVCDLHSTWPVTSSLWPVFAC